ncbi:hypothetical protein LTR74_017696 [Friedmanniomyces endolithicus]|nr:hypothetical protein LTR74_017696 [Friedmanniomyces endolithicus]
MLVLYGEGLVKAQQRLDSEINLAQKGPRHRDFTVPFSDTGIRGVEKFVGRKDELDNIHAAFVGDGKRRTVILDGLGGIGKTQLAVAYAKRYKDKYTAVFWLNVRDEASVKQSFAIVAKRILRYHPSASHVSAVDLSGNLDDILNAVLAWLGESDNTRWLAIYDNYDNPRVRSDHRPDAVDILEGITGVPFPRQDGLCMRFATEITLEHADTALHITASTIPAASCDERATGNLRAYSRDLTDFQELPHVISEVGELMGLRGYGTISSGPSFGKDVLRIKVCGNTGLCLSVVDLPGIIQTLNDEQYENDVEIVHALVDAYAANPRTIILAVAQEGNDISNQPIVQRPKRFDKAGERTIGIITKPDLINIGEQGRIALLARNKDTTRHNPTPHCHPSTPNSHSRCNHGYDRQGRQIVARQERASSNNANQPQQQQSGQNQMMHTVTDKVTGKTNPGDATGYRQGGGHQQGYGGLQQGAGGYQQGGHGGGYQEGYAGPQGGAGAYQQGGYSGGDQGHNGGMSGRAMGITSKATAEAMSSRATAEKVISSKATAEVTEEVTAGEVTRPTPRRTALLRQ